LVDNGPGIAPEVVQVSWTSPAAPAARPRKCSALLQPPHLSFLLIRVRPLVPSHPRNLASPAQLPQPFLIALPVRDETLPRLHCLPLFPVHRVSPLPSLEGLTQTAKKCEGRLPSRQEDPMALRGAPTNGDEDASGGPRGISNLRRVLGSGQGVQPRISQSSNLDPLAPSLQQRIGHPRWRRSGSANSAGPKEIRGMR
jgi:hypothetical protein